MNCVNLVRYSLVINDGVAESFIPSRGVRQGDPLSPFLLIICAEGLSRLLYDAKSNRVILGYKVSCYPPSVSHLFFRRRYHVIFQG